MELQTDTFRPFTKPNTVPLYVHCQSNHPPSVLKNIPDAINKRLSKISCNENVFNSAIPAYQEALEKMGYKHKLIFDPQVGKLKQEVRIGKEKSAGSTHLLT